MTDRTRFVKLTVKRVHGVEDKWDDVAFWCKPDQIVISEVRNGEVFVKAHGCGFYVEHTVAEVLALIAEAESEAINRQGMPSRADAEAAIYLLREGATLHPIACRNVADWLGEVAGEG